MLVKISSKAAECEEATTFLARKLVELDIEVNNILNKRSSTSTSALGDANCQNNEVSAYDTTIGVSRVKGIKKKEGVSWVKGRPKSCVKKTCKKGKDTHKYSPMRQQISLTMSIPITQVHENENSS